MIYVETWIKLLMFTYNLKLEISIKNCVLYIRKCCGGYDKCKCCQIKRSKQTDRDNYTYQNLKKMRLNNNLNNSRKKEKSSFLADKNRPFDALSFISNKDLFINDTIIISDDINDIPGPKSIAQQLSLIDESKEKRYGDDNDEYKEEEKQAEVHDGDDDIPKHAIVETQELEEMVVEMQDILQYTKTDDIESDE